MIPFSKFQTCGKCGSPHKIFPRHHKAWFKRDEWLEYECVCGYIFRTETADFPEATQNVRVNQKSVQSIDVVSELSKHA